ncbi:MAG: Peptidoglycan O-acetyltransferase [Phycisphaerales bacterium]|nr:Peptidoglycan O-acetyltransferase [Phycisphaerales bacterium]
MLFNSYEFVLLFLPITFFLFWYVGRSPTWRLALLTIASYAFYSAWQFRDLDELIRSFQIRREGPGNFLWHWRFTLVMLASSSVDYVAAAAMSRLPDNGRIRRRLLLVLSLSANIGLLVFFKYAGFFSAIGGEIFRFLGGGPLPVVAIVLPVGISFYTFESMSYVIDVYRGIAKPARSYPDYACFISFFPHLVAGPIIRWSDILHQFHDASWRRRGPDWPQVHVGLLLFTMGMAKKLLIADHLATATGPLWSHFESGGALGLAGSWAAVLGYTFRLYFDFSGYSDMATGLGHLFGVRLPQNFNSPYQATDPSDFWRRWHMTLSAWLRDYLFIPLGGSRRGTLLTVRNLLLTMLVGGLWHGAAWLFVLWGAWHGTMLAGYHLLNGYGWWASNGSRIGWWFNRQLTFLGVVIGWVLFRAADFHGHGYGWASITPAFKLLGQMAGVSRARSTADISAATVSPLLAALVPLCWAWCNFVPNSFEVAYGGGLRLRHAALAGLVLGICMLSMGGRMDFLYFRF